MKLQKTVNQTTLDLIKRLKNQCQYHRTSIVNPANPAEYRTRPKAEFKGWAKPKFTGKLLQASAAEPHGEFAHPL
jgi:hypothetical protein